MASAPVEKKIAFLSPSIGITSHRRSARRRYDSYCTTWNEVCVALSSCALTASMTRGCAWPTFITPIPPAKSTYLLPLTSQSSEPFARSAVIGCPVVMPRGTYFARSSASSASVVLCPTVTRPFKQIRSGPGGRGSLRGRTAVAGAAGHGQRAWRRDHQPELQGRGRGRRFRAPDGRGEDLGAGHRPGRRERRGPPCLRGWRRARGGRVRAFGGVARGSVHRGAADLGRRHAPARDACPSRRRPTPVPRGGGDTWTVRFARGGGGLQAEGGSVRGCRPVGVRRRARDRGAHPRGAWAADRGALPQRPAERELSGRRRDPDRRLGVRGHGRSVLRPGELLGQPRVRGGGRSESSRGVLRRGARRRSCLASLDAFHVRLSGGDVGGAPERDLGP